MSPLEEITMWIGIPSPLAIIGGISCSQMKDTTNFGEKTMNVFRHEAGHAVAACYIGLPVVDICGWHVAIGYEEEDHDLFQLAVAIMGGIIAGERRERDFTYHVELADQVAEHQVKAHGLDYAESDMYRLAWIHEQDPTAVRAAASEVHKALWDVEHLEMVTDIIEANE